MNFFIFNSAANAAVLSISPSTGSFVVGSTFSVSVALNTESQTVNTIAATLLFPADRLQLVSPSTGNSIISLWTSVPYVDNQSGKVTMQGGIPNGIQVGNGLVTTLLFRVKSVGTGFLKFADDSRVLLNDGQGTDVLRQRNDAIFSLTLPPPAGPIVASPSHPDQSLWYSIHDVSLNWASTDQIDSYSYILNDEPIDFPDDIPEGNKNALSYHALADGIHYFHIKALHNGVWGGTSHFALKIDTTPPAEFPMEIIPGERTTNPKPVIQFSTTDALSGVEHFELRLIPLTLDEPSINGAELSNAKSLFIEATSPYITTPLQRGTYDVVIRAYDNAKNYREVTKRLAIVSPLFQFVSSDGLVVGGIATIPWPLVLLSLTSLTSVLVFLSWRARRRHADVHDARAKKELPNHVLSQLEELKRYRSKYGTLLLVLVFGFGLLLNAAYPARAEQVSEIPPVISMLSRSITNNEIFYIGGRSVSANSTVVVYIQNLGSGETISETVTTDKDGNWFYRHNAFLSGGDYRLWVQTKVGDVLSPPSPQQVMTVRTDAIQIGVSRISFEALYFVITIFAILIILILATYLSYHSFHARRKHQLLQKEIREAEESVKRGFAVLRHDIQNQLQVLRKVKMTKELSLEEAKQEDQLQKDLQAMEAYIGKEVWDIEKAEMLPN